MSSKEPSSPAVGLIRIGLWLADRPMAVVHAAVLLACAIGVVAHQIWFWEWYIEDAAISFAYARNLAWGEGLVPSPGGERLEGYSNPTWVALLAVAEALGFDSFDSSKVFQTVFAFLTVPLTYRLTEEASPRPEEGSSLVAIGFLATSTTFAIWGASGLENALFSFLLAAALLRSALDIRKQSFPWAAFVWFLLAISRPEAILYCAVAGALTMVFTLHRGVVPTLQWLGAFFVPFSLYHALRFWYFAYEFPQTYYGKMTTKKPQPFAWKRRGWSYVRGWSKTLWTGYYLPIWAVAMLGTRGVRFGVGSVLTVATGLWLLLPEALEVFPMLIGPFEVDVFLTPLDFPAGWNEARSMVLISWALMMLVLGMGGERGWQVRALCWSVGASILFFAIYTMGDWMKAWRWMSLLQVPAAVLFGLGVGRTVDAIEQGFDWIEEKVPTGLSDKAAWGLIQVLAISAAFLWGRRYAFGHGALLQTVVLSMILALLVGGVSKASLRLWGPVGWALAALSIIMTTLPNFAHLKAQRGRPETGPFSIKSRVEFVRGVKQKLDLQHRIVDLDVDMGGHLWWGRDDFRMVDLAGLVDIPLAQHRFQKRFFRDYIFHEIKPDFAHVHGGWSKSSKIESFEEWLDDYYEIPGFPAGATQLHIGNYIRRDLFMKPDYPYQTARRVSFEEGWVLEDLEVPSEPATNRKGWFQIAIRSNRVPRGAGLPRVIVFASQGGEVVHSWEVPLAFDWLSTTAWKAGEVFVAGFPLTMVKEEMVPGSYDLGVVFVGPKHGVLSPITELPDGAFSPSEPVFMKGEVIFSDALQVVTLPELSTLARQDRLDAVQQARAGRCQKAEKLWDLSRWHRPFDQRYLDEHEPIVAANLSICWAIYADSHRDRAPLFLKKAAAWDDDQPRYLAVRHSVAEGLYREGLEAFAEEDWPRAFRLLNDAVGVEPTRSWARRYAEQARTKKLGLVEPK